MGEQIINAYKFIGEILAGLLIVTGSVGGIWSLLDKWKNRNPKLELFVPQYSTGQDSVSKRTILFMLIYILNSSLKKAHIIPTTMAVLIKDKRKWYKTQIAWIPNKTHLETDFTENEKTIQGVKDVKLLKRFESPVISYINPLVRYIVVTHPDESVLKSIDEIMIKVRDSQKRSYKMMVNLKKQKKKYDPNCQPERF